MHDCVTDILILIFTNINSQWEQLRHELMIVPVSVMLKSFFFNYKLRVAAWGFMIIKRLEIVRSIILFLYFILYIPLVIIFIRENYEEKKEKSTVSGLDKAVRAYRADV